MSATIRDVAREAGVSVTTVSRALNDSGPVKAATRQRVSDAAQRLHFSPNTTARSLSTRRTHTLGVLLPDVYGGFFAEVIRGIDQTAQQHGFHVLISGAHNETAEVHAAVRAMRGRVDGLILMAAELDTETLARNLPEGVPVVLINADHDASRFDTINIDNFGGALAMPASRRTTIASSLASLRKHPAIAVRKSCCVDGPVQPQSLQRTMPWPSVR
jgi:LacI family transcriptional regulator